VDFQEGDAAALPFAGDMFDFIVCRAALYPEAANTVIFAAMVLVLLIRPAGLFGAEK
jgi:branched-subunit amino acid ABC-type transport system permease component